MRTFLLSDSINQMHWNVLKSILVILAILPISHGLLNVFQQIDGSSRIIFGFLSISLFSASCIIAFMMALKNTTLVCDEIEEKAERMIFNLYRQVPMLFFATIILSVVLKI